MKTKEPGFFNRELSWLEFNQRVLGEAQDPSVPLLERLKFLAITASNLDEFFMVRVGGLELLVEGGERRRDPAGLTPRQQLERVEARVRRMVHDQYACFSRVLEPALAEHGIRRPAVGALSGKQRSYFEGFFSERVFPVVTPMAVTGEFPEPLNLGLNLAVRMADAEGPRSARFAVIPLPANLERFVAVPDDAPHAYLPLEDLIGLFLPRLFPGREPLEWTCFRVTRNADLTVREEASADFLALMEQVLAERKRTPCIRVECGGRPSEEMTEFLRAGLEVRPSQIYRVGGPVDLADFMGFSVSGLDRLRDEPWPPQPSPDVDAKRSIFDEIAARDVLLHHPYESFDPVVRLVESAASDPDVLAIKQILYRTSARSPIVAALRKAAERGKSVTALVELKARFDEARNIEWARDLERSGVQVIYGVQGLKTHAKLCIVVRRESAGVARYMHFGTGNYNERTACLYGDVGLLTRAPDLGADASEFFNAVCGYSEPPAFRKIAAAPIGLRERLLGLIEGEIERCRQGQEAGITAKINSLVDREISEALYRASRAGVRVRLNVRGICCLRPGVKGLSENIEVISIVDRFLEHARVFCFQNGGDPRVFVSSADWMPRNLDRRIELMTPIEAPALVERLVGVLDQYFLDTTKSHRLMPDGRYERVRPVAGQRPFRVQEALYRDAARRVRDMRRKRPTAFVPHRAPGKEDGV